MSDIPTLRARVEAAQRLAAKATPGPWIVHPRQHTSGWGTCVGPDNEMIARMTGGRGSSPKQRAVDAAMLAASPDLVTLATDLLALTEKQAAELTAIRTALGNGADEAAWTPGLTVAEAVGRLRGEREAVVAWLLERAMMHGQEAGTAANKTDAICLIAREQESLAIAAAVQRGEHMSAMGLAVAAVTTVSALCNAVVSERPKLSGFTVRTLCPLPAGHEGPHAEALGAGDGAGDGGGR